MVAVLRPDPLFNASDAVLYVAAGDGNDNNNGRSPRLAKATIQAAYDALPSGGGTVILSPTSHYADDGVEPTNHKPAHVMAYGGKRLTKDGYPSVYGIGSQLFTTGATGGFTDYGWAFSGINFVITHASNTRAIQANDLNELVVENCAFQGDTAVEKYGIRSNSPLFADLSWYSLRNNHVKDCGLIDGASGEINGNNNGHDIVGNKIFPGNNSWGMKLYGAERCWIVGNTIEGNGPGGIRLTGPSKYNWILGHGGEGTVTPYGQCGASTSENIMGNYGSNTAQANLLIWEDLSGNNHTLWPANYQYVQDDQTADFTLATIWKNALVLWPVNKATDVAVTFPPNASVPWGIGRSTEFYQKGVGQIDFTAGAGVTLLPANHTKTRTRYSHAKATKVATNTWLISGDIV